MGKSIRKTFPHTLAVLEWRGNWEDLEAGLTFRCRVNFHILLLFLELDSMPLGTLCNGPFAPHSAVLQFFFQSFIKKAKVTRFRFSKIDTKTPFRI